MKGNVLTGCQVPELGLPSKAVLGLLTVPLGYQVSAPHRSAVLSDSLP